MEGARLWGKGVIRDKPGTAERRATFNRRLRGREKGNLEKGTSSETERKRGNVSGG